MHALPPRVALVPNAIAFVDPSHGIAGTGWQSCTESSFGCRPQGTISATSDGGRTWRVVLRTSRPVVAVSIEGGAERAIFDDGENLVSNDGGKQWSAAAPLPARPTPCTHAYSTVDIATTPAGGEFAVCAGAAAAGSQDKAVYRLDTLQARWIRVAWTPWPSEGKAYGGISAEGYPVGIAMADGGFGLIWESRGTLFVTRDNGSSWIGLPKIARPDVDFSESAVALDGGVGYVILATNGGTEIRQLLVTRNAGRTWSVVHRWS